MSVHFSKWDPTLTYPTPNGEGSLGGVGSCPVAPPGSIRSSKVSRGFNTVPSRSIHLAFEKFKPSHLVCVLGNDVTIDMVLTLSQRDLIGRFEYIKPYRSDILAWVQECWKPLLKSVPKVLTLVNGWVLFQILSIEDREAFESQYWILGLGSLVLGTSMWDWTHVRSAWLSGIFGFYFHISRCSAGTCKDL